MDTPCDCVRITGLIFIVITLYIWPGYAKSLSDTDSSEVAVLSWSWGGISSLFAAARDTRIDALLSMDGSMRYYPGLVKRAGDIHSERMTIALLFFTRNVSLEDLENDDALSADTVGPNVLNAWTHGDLFTVNMLGMSHPEFSSMFQGRESAQRFAENQVAEHGRTSQHELCCLALYTLNFLDGYLKHDASAKAFLARTSAENGVPKHVMDVRFRAALKRSQTRTLSEAMHAPSLRNLRLRAA